LRRKGERARPARRKRAEEEAAAGRASFITRPSGKFVPYSTEETSKSARGHR